MKYILNGKLIDEDQINLPVEKNGSFWYGDGFFEAMKYGDGRIFFLDEHWERINISCSLLKMANPIENETQLAHFARQLVQARKDKVSRLKLTLWRNNFQAYLPEDETIQYLMVGFTHEHLDYPLNPTGLKLAIYSENLKSVSKLGNIKSTSAQLYVLATLNTQQLGLDDSIILNTKKHLIETSRSNLFIVMDGVIFTPPLNEGCLDGIMRRILLQVCNEENIPLQQEPITLEMLQKAEEVFTSSSIRGIQWVQQVNEWKYSGQTRSKQLCSLLNKRALRF
jgi:branched-chain amino acid aminotransferase